LSQHVISPRFETVQGIGRAFTYRLVAPQAEKVQRSSHAEAFLGRHHPRFPVETLCWKSGTESLANQAANRIKADRYRHLEGSHAQSGSGGSHQNGARTRKTASEKDMMA
jgi:hypothetical protein